ncbi:MAG: AAA family ATPase [Cyanobacteria bacterium P01_G01_bin.39]
MSDLKDTVVIAGTNGCGKSCIFHAIRFFKSIYGNYIEKELEKWFNEFDIDNRTIQKDFIRLFQNEESDINISIGFTFQDTEKEYILSQSKIQNSSKTSLIRAASPMVPGEEEIVIPSLANDLRTQKKAIEEQNKIRNERIKQELEESFVLGRVTIQPDMNVKVLPCPTLEIAFSS